MNERDIAAEVSRYLRQRVSPKGALKIATLGVHRVTGEPGKSGMWRGYVNNGSTQSSYGPEVHHDSNHVITDDSRPPCEQRWRFEA